MRIKLSPALLFCCFGVASAAVTVPAADTDDKLMRAGSEAGKISNTEKDLFQDAASNAKRSIALETLDFFYQDAMELYRARRYDEALMNFERIYSADPNFKDVAQMRLQVLKLKNSAVQASNRVTIQEIMGKGNRAAKAGQTVQAMTFWKEALAIDPNYAPAKKKIEESNKVFGQKQFQAGYVHYKHGDLEDALDAWTLAIAYDPSLKNRGLLVLMAKVELAVKKDKVARLASQGFDQYQAGDFQGSLQSYSELVKLEPRHEEGQRMSAKIRIQLGQVAFKSAQEKMAAKKYQDAIADWELCLKYGFEKKRSEAGIQEAKAKIEAASKPVVVSKPKSKPTKVTPPPAAEPQEPPPPPPAPVAKDPIEAKVHYRKGMAAIRNKDFNLAVQEFEKAYDLDPTDERIYMGLERARQEWRGMSAAGAVPQ
jgi:tetratricopeptide (TPR) repeat protein